MHCRKELTMALCQDWVFGEINSVGLPCVTITPIGEIAMKDNPTSQSAKQLGSVSKDMRIIVKPKVCFFNRFRTNVNQGMCEQSSIPFGILDRPIKVY